MLYKNWIRNIFRSIGYPIVPPSKLYEDNQEKIQIVLADRITPQVRPLNVLITGLHELNLQKRFEMVDTRSYMQLDDLNSKTHDVKNLRDLISHAIGVRFCPPPGSEYYKLLHLGMFHG